MSQSEPWLRVHLGNAWGENQFLELTSPVVLIDPWYDATIDNIFKTYLYVIDEGFHPIVISRYWESFSIKCFSNRDNDWKNSSLKFYSKKWKLGITNSSDHEESIVSIDPVSGEIEPGESPFFVKYLMDSVYNRYIVNKTKIEGWIVFLRSIISSNYNIYRSLTAIHLNYIKISDGFVDVVSDIINDWLSNPCLFEGKYRISSIKGIHVKYKYGGDKWMDISIDNSGEGFKTFLKFIPGIIYALLTGKILIITDDLFSTLDAFNKRALIKCIAEFAREIPEKERGKLVLLSYTCYEHYTKQYSDTIQTIELG